MERTCREHKRECRPTLWKHQIQIRFWLIDSRTIWGTRELETQATGLIAFLHVRQLHNLGHSRARNSSVRPSYVFCRPTVTQSESLESWKLKPQTRLQFCPFDSLVNLPTKMLEAQAIRYFFIVSEKRLPANICSPRTCPNICSANTEYEHDKHGEHMFITFLSYMYISIHSVQSNVNENVPDVLWTMRYIV